MHLTTIDMAESCSKTTQYTIPNQDELNPVQNKMMWSKSILYVFEYDHLMNPPAKKKP